jgi:hypothetical protein
MPAQSCIGSGARGVERGTGGGGDLIPERRVEMRRDQTLEVLSSTFFPGDK